MVGKLEYDCFLLGPRLLAFQGSHFCLNPKYGLTEKIGEKNHLEEPKKVFFFLLKTFWKLSYVTRIPPQQKSTGVRRAVGGFYTLYMT